MASLFMMSRRIDGRPSGQRLELGGCRPLQYRGLIAASDVPSFVLRGVMDVHDLDHLSGIPIKYFVRISEQRHGSNTWSFGDFLGAVRPHANTSNHRSQPDQKRVVDGWIITSDIGKNLVEVFGCFVGVDDLHAGRCFLKSSSIRSSVANRPSRAALRPRSMPASSCG